MINKFSIPLAELYLFIIFLISISSKVIFNIFGRDGATNGIIFLICMLSLFIMNKHKTHFFLLISAIFLWALIGGLSFNNLSSVFKNFIPIICFTSGMLLSSKAKNLNMLIPLFLFIGTAPIIDRFLLGKSDFGENTGYFLFSKEGNLFSYIFLGLLSIYFFVTHHKLYYKIFFTIVSLYSIYLMSSKFALISAFLILSYVLFLFKRHWFFFTVAVLIPIIYYYALDIFELIFRDAGKILWRVNIDKQSIVMALLSARNLSLSDAINLYINSDYNLLLFGDLFTPGDTIPYVEMDLFHAVFDYGIFGILLILTEIFYLSWYCKTLRNTPYYISKKNAKAFKFSFILIILGGSITGHLFFRAPGAFLVGTLYSILLRASNNENNSFQ